MTPEERARIEGEIEGIHFCLAEIPMNQRAIADRWCEAVAELRRLLAEDELEAQRRSFAFGNTSLANDNITRETIDKAAESFRSALIDATRNGKRVPFGADALANLYRAAKRLTEATCPSAK